MADILGIGFDVAQRKKGVSPARLAERILTKREKKEYDAMATAEARTKYVYGRWAAKEAVIKAVGRPVPLADIQVTTGPAGEPLAALRGSILLVSVSHASDRSYAFAVALKKP